MHCTRSAPCPSRVSSLYCNLATTPEATHTLSLPRNSFHTSSLLPPHPPPPRSFSSPSFTHLTTHPGYHTDIVLCFAWQHRFEPWKRPTPGAGVIWLAYQQAADSLDTNPRTCSLYVCGQVLGSRWPVLGGSGPLQFVFDETLRGGWSSTQRHSPPVWAGTFNYRPHQSPTLISFPWNDRGHYCGGMRALKPILSTYTYMC
ncbi:hypothetical protein F5883DRAFT_243959 [Diaporthe sp. PMI_573]|nr:hypothetical protein F5883DRAFT_243959 [Diaporthaceae sp. PMI_573]